MVIFMSKEIKKCFICKEEIDLVNKKDSFFIDKKNTYKHINCFIEYKTNLKIKKWTKKQCEEYISEMNNICLCNTQNKNIRIQLTDWIFNKYNVSFLPTYFYTKLDSIYKGTFKGLSRPVPPEDLLDMWQRKIEYLNKVATQNINSGKSMDQYGRINYDLAILLSKYDSYLEWKDKQRIIKEEILSRATNQNRINYKKIIKQVNSSDTEIDIVSMLDEI
jgi:hypothetical protein